MPDSIARGEGRRVVVAGDPRCRKTSNFQAGTSA